MICAAGMNLGWNDLRKQNLWQFSNGLYQDPIHISKWASAYVYPFSRIRLVMKQTEARCL